MVFDESLAKALQQMRFAQSAISMDKQRVVLSAGKFGDIKSSVVRKLIALTNDEAVNVVPKPGTV